jgi:hypothetical protein
LPILKQGEKKMLNVGMPTDNFLKIIKNVSIKFIEVLPNAEYELHWNSKEPQSSEEIQVLDTTFKGSGPVFIAVLSD